METLTCRATSLVLCCGFSRCPGQEPVCLPREQPGEGCWHWDAQSAKAVFIPSGVAAASINLCL